MEDDPPDYLPTELPSIGILQNPTITQVQDDRQYKSWICLYPVYFDSTKSVQHGRKVVREQAVPNPLAQNIAEAVKELGLSVLFEPEKTHPRDWGNPGRVRVSLRNQNIPINPSIPTRKELIKKVSTLLSAVQENNKLPFPPKHSPAVSSGLLKDNAGSSTASATSSSVNASSSNSAAAAASGGASQGSSSSTQTQKKKGRKGRK
ncbi:2877_t:CDS:2 [Ambispora gerdemannii]|uniref:2877_t:CDS:1 n=1 Tax=Ambispora gerdemannii TaxID=144530 RepID=A0A9N8ZER0_9GLOM|nr:2877_t:CDS:2 [Ambispora gerdemannii]